MTTSILIPFPLYDVALPAPHSDDATRFLRDGHINAPAISFGSDAMMPSIAVSKALKGLDMNKIRDLLRDAAREANQELPEDDFLVVLECTPSGLLAEFGGEPEA